MMKAEEVRPTLIDVFPPPPWFGINALRRQAGQVVYKGRMVAPEGAYFIKENGSPLRLSDRELKERARYLKQWDRYALYEIRGEIRFYLGKRGRDAPLWRGNAYIYYDIHPNELRVVDLVVEENLRRRGFGTVLVRLVEDRARLYGVGNISGASTREGRAFWRSVGYTVDNSHMEKKL